MGREPKTDWEVVKIRDEVVRSLATYAAEEIEGVAGLSHGWWGSFWKFFTDQDRGRGITVDIRGPDVRVRAAIVVDYGVNIPQVAEAVRESIRRALERYAGISPAEVHVEVAGVTQRRTKR